MTSTMQFLCMYCDFSCADLEENIQQHMKEVHPEDDPIYITEDPTDQSQLSAECDEVTETQNCINEQLSANQPTGVTEHVQSVVENEPANPTVASTGQTDIPEPVIPATSSEDTNHTCHETDFNKDDDPLNQNETLESANVHSIAERAEGDDEQIINDPVVAETGDRNFQEKCISVQPGERIHMPDGRHGDGRHGDGLLNADEKLTSNISGEVLDSTSTMRILEAHSIADDPDLPEHEQNAEDTVRAGTLFINYNNPEISNSVPGVLSQANDCEQNDPTLPRITCVEAQVDFVFSAEDEMSGPADNSFYEKHNSDAEPVPEAVYSHQAKSCISQTHPTMRSLLSSPTKTHPQLANVLTQPNSENSLSPPTPIGIAFIATPSTVTPPVQAVMPLSSETQSPEAVILKVPKEKKTLSGQSVPIKIKFPIAKKKKVQVKSKPSSVSEELNNLFNMCKSQKSKEKMKWFQCGKCDIWFCSVALIREHLSQVHKLRSYKCKFCDYTVSSMVKVKLHVSGFHSKETYKCLHCQEAFGTVSETRKHLKTIHHLTIHVSDTDYSTVAAVTSNKSTKGFTELHLKHTQCRRLPEWCTVHNEKFPGRKSVSIEEKWSSDPITENKVSIKIEKTDESEKTEEVGQGQVDDSDVEIISETKPVLGLFCKECHFFVDGELRRTDKTDILESHLLSQHNVCRYQCNDCSFNTSDKGDIRRHVRFQHVMWTYRCKICRRYWAEESEMIAHFNERHPSYIHRKKSNRYARVQDMRFSEQYHDVTLQLYTASVMPDTGLTDFEASDEISCHYRCKFCTCFVGNCEHSALVNAIVDHVKRSHPEHAGIEVCKMYKKISTSQVKEETESKGQSEREEECSEERDEWSDDCVLADLNNARVTERVTMVKEKQEINEVKQEKEKKPTEAVKAGQETNANDADHFTAEKGTISPELGIRVFPRNKKSSGMGFRTYACSACGFATMGNINYTKKKSLLAWHFQTIHNWMQFQCGVCGLQSDSSDLIRMHIYENHREMEYQCRVCKRCWYTADDILKHVAEHDMKRPPPKYNLVTPGYAKGKHQKTQRKLYSTSVVSKVKERLIDLFDERIVMVHNRDIRSISTIMYACVHCDMRVLERNQDSYGLALQQHICQYHQEISMRDLSAPDFTTYDLTTPSANKTEVGDGIDDRCDDEEEESISTVSSATAAPVSKSQSCPHCSFMISGGKVEKSELRHLMSDHFRDVHNLIQFKCMECPYQSNDRGDVINHLQSRHLLAEYHCKFCKKFWRNEEEVIEHVKIHGRQRPRRYKTGRGKKTGLKLYRRAWVRNFRDRILDRFLNQAVEIETESLQGIHFTKCPRCSLMLSLDNEDVLSHTMQQHVQRYHSQEKVKRRRSTPNFVPNKKRRFSADGKPVVHLVSPREFEVYKCDFGGCEFMSRQQSHLKEHYIIHSYQTVYKCGRCNSHYSTSPSKFKTHTKHTHKVEDPLVLVSQDHGRTYEPFKGYGCMFEDCRFYTDRRNIMRRHEGFHERSHHFKCDTCCELFTHPSSIKKRIHSCDKEGRAFVLLETRDGGETYRPSSIDIDHVDT